MSDKNFKSYDGEQVDVFDESLDPIAAGWAPGSWQDTARFYKRIDRLYKRFHIIDGGTEDGADISNHNYRNYFGDFWVSAGDKYVLTLKGASCDNVFDNWTITKPGNWVDIQIGNWHDQDLDDPTIGVCPGNIFYSIARVDGKPVRYAYRWGCRPKFYYSNTKHLWWMSIGLTIYWWAKYLWLKVRP